MGPQRRHRDFAPVRRRRVVRDHETIDALNRVEAGQRARVDPETFTATVREEADDRAVEPTRGGDVMRPEPHVRAGGQRIVRRGGLLRASSDRSENCGDESNEPIRHGVLRRGAPLSYSPAGESNSGTHVYSASHLSIPIMTPIPVTAPNSAPPTPPAKPATNAPAFAQASGPVADVRSTRPAHRMRNRTAQTLRSEFRTESRRCLPISSSPS